MLKQTVCAMLALNPAFRFVTVHFGDSKDKLYTYLSLIARDIEPGMHVVVPAAGRLSIATVVTVNTSDHFEVKEAIDYKWLIQIVDTAEYDAHLALQAEAIELVKETNRKKQRERLLTDYSDEQLKKLVRF